MNVAELKSVLEGISDDAPVIFQHRTHPSIVPNDSYRIENVSLSHDFVCLVSYSQVPVKATVPEYVPGQLQTEDSYYRGAFPQAGTIACKEGFKHGSREWWARVNEIRDEWKVTGQIA